MGLESAVTAVKTQLETISNVVVYISANEPDAFWDTVDKADWPTATQRTIVLYAGNSDVTIETGKRFRRLHNLQINIYIRDDDQTTRGNTLHGFFDEVDEKLKDPPGATSPGRSESIETIQQPLAGHRLFAKLNYCGGE